MAYQACLSSIREASGLTDMTDDEAQEMLDSVLAAKGRIVRARGLADGDAMALAAKEVADRQAAASAATRIAALNNAVKRNAILARAEGEAAGNISNPRVSALRLIPGAQRLDLADGLQSIMTWLPRAANKDTVEKMGDTIARSVKGIIEWKLRRDGLEKLALSDVLRYEVAEARWRLKGGIPDATVTISPEAQKIAEAFHPALEYIKDRQNAAAGQKIIGDAPDYVMETHWDPRQLRGAAGPRESQDAAFAAWVKDDLPRMAEKTFDEMIPGEGETELQAKAKFLRSAFDSRLTGVRYGAPSDPDTGYIPIAFEGTQNIARGLGHERVFFWKTARDWADHQKQFGGGDTLYSQVARAVNGGARNASLMHYFGTNPAGNLNLVIRQIQEKYRGQADALNRFEGHIPRLENVMGRLDGTLNSPAHADRFSLTNSFENLMAIEATSHLGAVSVTHVAAAPMTISSEMAHHGVGHLESLANVVRGLYHFATPGRGSAETQEIGADAGAYAHGWANALHRSQPWTGRGLPGFVSRAASEFMRLTGLPRALDNFQWHAVKEVLMSRLGKGMAAPLAEMEDHQQALIRSYGIGDKDWELLRAVPDRVEIEGRSYLTPSEALKTDPAAIEAMMRGDGRIPENASDATVSRHVQDYQWDMSDKIGMYLNDAADHGVVMPGVRERAIALRGARPGDVGYMMARAFAQFKMWPLAAMNQILGRDIAMSQTKGQFWKGIGWIFALSALGGAGRMALNDAVVGRPQRDYTNPVTLLQALAQGGGLGIYGDFLFGEANRMGTGLIGTLGGPIASDIDRLINLFERTKADLRDNPGKALQHMMPDMAHLLVGHVPFGNLIYLKGALDYLLWYHLYEAASPGWWQRTNARLQKESGRPMLGYAPGGRVPFGVPGLYLQQPGGSAGLLAQGKRP